MMSIDDSVYIEGSVYQVLRLFFIHQPNLPKPLVINESKMPGKESYQCWSADTRAGPVSHMHPQLAVGQELRQSWGKLWTQPHL